MFQTVQLSHHPTKQSDKQDIRPAAPPCLILRQFADLPCFDIYLCTQSASTAAAEVEHPNPSSAVANIVPTQAAQSRMQTKVLNRVQSHLKTPSWRPKQELSRLPCPPPWKLTVTSQKQPARATQAAQSSPAGAHTCNITRAKQMKYRQWDHGQTKYRGSGRMLLMRSPVSMWYHFTCKSTPWRVIQCRLPAALLLLGKNPHTNGTDDSAVAIQK
jgi:hypothetical protein